VETALHCLVYKVVRALGDGFVALGALMDIEGAFDNTSFGSTCREAEVHGLEHNLIRWIHAMLSNKQILTTQMDHMMSVSVSWECPQGRVLSFLLWCLVADQLLLQLNKEGLYTQGYADDSAVLTTGKFPGIVSELMQRALNVRQRWYRAEELSVNPSKKEHVLFTKKRKVEAFVEPILLNTVLHTTR
jgi:hypothetical protein